MYIAIIILGKTTFINDVHKANMHSIYIRQYHKIRPYIKISSIPNFDPTEVSNYIFYNIYHVLKYNYLTSIAMCIISCHIGTYMLEKRKTKR